MKAADIMSRSVIAIGPGAPLEQAVRLMIQHGVSGLPVIDASGGAVGILTEGDLLRRVEAGTEGHAPGWFASIFLPGRLAGEYVQTHGRRVEEVMTPDIVTVTEDTPLSDVISLMQRRRIRRVPVERGGKVVGVVSRADIVRLVGAAFGAPAATASDATIRQVIMDRLATQPWAHNASVSVAVQNGKVMIDGCVFDMRQHDAFRVLAENVSGVKAVENRLVCIEPNTGMLVYGPEDEAVRPAGE